jgi:phosphoribosylformylglycinamidine synthase subunit PurS
MKNYLAKIIITLRAGILDVQGKAVENALHSIEFQTLKNVRIGKFVTLHVDAINKEEAYKIVEEATRKLIANPIIEDFRIEIDELD